MFSIKVEIVIIFKEEEGGWIKRNIKRVSGGLVIFCFLTWVVLTCTLLFCTLFLTRVVFTIKINL